MARGFLPAEERARRWMGVSLAGLLGAGILLLWVPRRWPVSLVQVGILLLAAVWLAGAARNRFPLRFHPLMIPLAGAVLWGCGQIAAGRTIYRWATEVAVLDWFTRLVVFFLAYQLFTGDAFRRRVLDALLWFGFLLGVVAVLQRFSAPHRIFWLFAWKADGAMGPFVYHNQYATFVETVLPLAVFSAFTRRRGGWGYLVMAGALIASVVVAQSRAGTFLVVMETVAVTVLAGRRSRYSGRNTGRVAGGMALVAVVFIAAVGWQPLAEKFERRDPFGVRRYLLYSSLAMVRERPVLGFGLGTWSTAYPAYAAFDDGHFENQAHNDWVQWAAEGGIPFFGLLLLAAGLLVRPALRSIWGVGLLAVFAHCLVDYPFQQRPVFGYFFFALAAVMLISAAAAQHRHHGPRQDEQLQPE